MKKILKIDTKDNVAVAIGDLKKGDVIDIDGHSVRIMNNVNQGHKVALADIENGGPVIKYGQTIGYTVMKIQKGEWVHSHNLVTSLSDTVIYEYRPQPAKNEIKQSRTFLGYLRAGGKCGIRNEVWIIPTVGCVNGIAKKLEKLSKKYSRSDDFDGVYAFTHPYGCSQLDDDHENTKKILAGLTGHPNAACVLVLGLGCENNLISEFKKSIKDIDNERTAFLEAQSVEDELSTGMALIENLVKKAKTFRRQKLSVANLTVGLKCGGSDGYSGITANPLVGMFSDKLIAQGGSAILTEVPEMFGTEQMLLNRGETKAIFIQAKNMINDFKAYYTRNNQPIYENPSPGNKEGGITTLEEKSLGCIQKGGQSTVRGVLKYGEPVKAKGLNLLSAPGNDLVSSTALVASGAQMLLFTTGRGTPFGSPVPTVKISSNSQLYKNKSNWIDFDAGGLAYGQDSGECAGKLMEYVISLASGEAITKSEANGYRNMAIFKSGVTL